MCIRRVIFVNGKMAKGDLRAVASVLPDGECICSVGQNVKTVLKS